MRTSGEHYTEVHAVKQSLGIQFCSFFLNRKHIIEAISIENTVLTHAIISGQVFAIITTFTFKF